jgi:predicted HD phosphohydrolase
MRKSDDISNHPPPPQLAATVFRQGREAEKHLAAFYHAVSQLYGPLEAEQAVDDWLREFEAAMEKAAHIRFSLISAIAAHRISARLIASRQLRATVEKFGGNLSDGCMRYRLA